MRLTLSPDSCTIEPLYRRTKSAAAETDIVAFQSEIVGLIRALGLHKPDQTPCGQPISVAEAQAVHELAREPGISQNGLAAKLRLEKSTVSRLAAILERRGWLERRRDRRDSRILRLYLSKAGQNAAGNLARSRAEKFRRVFEGIPERRRAAVMDSLSLLRGVLDET